MFKLLKSLGIGAWCLCLLILIYQGLTWVFTAHWPSITLLDASDQAHITISTILQNLPLEYGLKLTYVLTTTELSIALWWTGVFFFLAALVYRFIQK